MSKRSELQLFDEKIMYIETNQILNSFYHFKERYEERFSVSKLYYIGYWKEWIQHLRGTFVTYDNNGNMIRMIGDYIKDEKHYKVIYTKIKKYNIYVPVTIYELDHKKAYRMYLRILKNKKK